MAATSDQDLIVQTALDYFEGWFDGDVSRMERALHPDLAKRWSAEADGRLRTLTKVSMVELTAAGAGSADATDRRLDVVVLDVEQEIASVVVRSAPYYEYLHLVRTREGWRIVNALYRTR